MRLIISLGSWLFAALWEFSRPRRVREFPTVRRYLGNLGLWLCNMIWITLLLQTVHPERVAGIGLPTWPVWTGSLIAGFLLLDLLRYLLHRCKHAIPFLWRFHALHHSDPDLDTTSTVRLHPGEDLLNFAVFWLLSVMLLGVPIEAGLVYALAAFVIEVFQHANIRLPDRLDARLQLILVTPDMHRIHHAIDYAQPGANFATVFSFWDRLAGTYVHLTPAQHDNIVFGVAGLPRPDACRFTAMLLTPWRLGRARPDLAKVLNEEAALQEIESYRLRKYLMPFGE